VLKGPVALSPHDPKWSGLFAAERDRLMVALAPYVLAVEHIGVDDRVPAVVDALRARVANVKELLPVLVTSMHRRNFDSLGHIINTLAEYPEAMRQTATEENVALIDLNAMSKILYETWGPELSIKAFVHYPANSFPNQTEALKDNTHFNPYGAYELASCIVSSIRKQNLALAKFIRKQVPAYDPAKPLPVEKFYWPASVFVTSTKPDGN